VLRASANWNAGSTDADSVLASEPLELIATFASERVDSEVVSAAAASKIAVLLSDIPKDPDIVMVRAKVLAAPSLKSNSLVIVTASVSTAFSEMLDDRD
jgi:hypothetical protein